MRDTHPMGSAFRLGSTVTILALLLVPVLAATSAAGKAPAIASGFSREQPFTSSPDSCTTGCAMGNATKDGSPFSWKNRDGNGRHFVWYVVSGGTYDYLAMGNSEGLKMGVNEAGLSLQNSLIQDIPSPGYTYENNTAFKTYCLSECGSVAEVRQAIIEDTSGIEDHWPAPSICPSFSDAHGYAATFELGAEIYYEYDPTNPNRLAQFPRQFVARANASHQNPDHTDDETTGGNRYVTARNDLQYWADNGGLDARNWINQVSRHGEPGVDTIEMPSRSSTRAVMLVHGVNEGEDPRIVTAWLGLGNPDYTCVIPAWVAQGSTLSPWVTSGDQNSSIAGLSEQLYWKHDDEQYDQYINGLIRPLEDNIFEAVEAARARWFDTGFSLDEATRIHMEAADTAWHTMNAMNGGSGRSLNVTPSLTAITASIDGLQVSFGCVADDADGSIVAYDWDFGDEGASTSPSPVHSYSSAGTYLVRCRVVDSDGSRNSKWKYVTVSVTNAAARVDAGADQVVTLPGAVSLDGTVTDDGLPDPPGAVVTEWRVVSGPGMVSFTDAAAPDAIATFSEAGSYVLELVAEDGELSASDQVLITVESASVIRVPQDYASIQAAIDVAQDGDLILVSPGTFVENLFISRKAVILASEFYTTRDPGLIEQTIIDGGGSAGITVDASVGPETTITGFTIQNCEDGIFPAGALNIVYNRFSGNVDAIDYEGGGGVCRYNVFEYNADDAVDLDGATGVTIEDNVIRYNDDDGIEIRLYEYSGPVLNIIIRDNVISGNGEDGIQIIDYPDLSDRFILIEHNLIQANAMAGLGLMDNGQTVEDYRAASIPERIQVYNNTFIGNDHGLTGGDNLIALNNLFVSSSSLAMKGVDGDSVAAYNLFWNNGTDYVGSNLDLATTLFADPVLDSASRLQPASPAIDAGIAYFEWLGEIVLELPETGFLGEAPDLGAYESNFGTRPAVLIDAPAEGAIFNEGDLIVFGGSASDAEDGDLTGAMSWSSSLDGSIGTGGYFSRSDLSLGVHTITATVIDSDGMVGIGEITISVAPSGPVVVTEVRVETSLDDAEESEAGYMYMGSSDIEMAYDTYRPDGNPPQGNQVAGMRFNGVDIPPGATVVNAYLQFQVDETSSDAISLVIEAEASDDASPFVTSYWNMSSRARTQAAVTWSPVAWTTVGEAGLDQRTPDLSAAIQEIVSRPGWQSGNSLVIMVRSTEATSTGRRIAESYDGEPSSAPLLHVEYTTGDVNDPPVASFTYSCTGLDCDFDAASTYDPDGNIVSYEWGFGDGNTGSGLTASHSYATSGSYSVLLTVTDDDGATDDDIQMVTVAPVNDPPVASFTYSCTGMDCDFDAASTYDPDGNIVSYEWDFGDGNTGSGPAPSHIYATSGSYSVNLTVTDDDGATDDDSQVITVAAVNDAPVASFTYSCTGLGCYFDASGSYDPDGSIASYDWDFGDGNTGSGLTASHSYATSGSYSVLLTVTDDDGATDDDIQMVTVAAVNDAPVASFTYSCTGLECGFDASGSYDPDGSIVSYEWDFGDGNTGSGLAPSHIYATSGSYSVNLTVTDDDGATDDDSQVITVAAVNDAPVASFTYSCTGLGCGFDASGSYDPDGSIASYDWDFGDGNTGSGLTASHSYATSGSYSVLLTVTDDDGATNDDSQVITVAAVNDAPVASFTYSCTGLGCDFDASGSYDPDGSIVSYEWDFGDGNTGSGLTASHSYATSGSYSVLLTVTDDDGATDGDIQVVTVTPVNDAPVASFTYSCTGLGCYFDASGSYDPDGSIASYDWDFGDGNTGSDLTASHSYATPGSYSVLLTVTDDDGATDDDTQVVTVSGTPGTMHVGDLAASTSPAQSDKWDATVTITVHEAHSEAETPIPVAFATVSGSWSAGVNGSDSCTTDSSGQCSIRKSSIRKTATAVTFTVDDLTHATLTYNPGDNHDADGDSDGTSITVTPVNDLPVASFTCSCTGLDCGFDASGSYDPDGSIVSYEWDFGDGNTGSGLTASHSYATPGSYSVLLTVTDDDGATDDDSQVVTVAAVNDAPVASFTYSCTGLGCYFDASGSYDPDGSIASYEWDFGDGNTGSGLAASHSYATPGSYTVLLTVTDDDGATDDDTQAVTVSGTPGTVHVGDLAASTSPAQSDKWDATVTITVHEAHGEAETPIPVAFATVSGSWSAGVNGSDSCTTDSSGQCSIRKSSIRKTATAVTFTVDDLTHATLTYNSGDNHDADDDSDGTSITIPKPWSLSSAVTWR